ncbi:MAG: ABC transporter substrate-binding protein [Thermomicrobiales bacterium]|nr:ABC transporter substrate-binding protein [Thermomicrobiales bacterium]
MTEKRAFSLDRRHLLGGAAAVAAGAALRSGHQVQAAPANVSAKIAAGFQAEENVILIGTLGEAQTINPFLVNDTEAYFRVKMLYEQFLRIDPATFAPTGGPGLVAEYSLEELTYTFTLHDNATFSDGSDVTTDDVVFTFLGLLDPANASPNGTHFTTIVGAPEFAAGTADSVSGIEVVDAKTLKITLASPDASFLYNLRTVHVVPKAALEGKSLTDDPFFDNPIGAGPFKFVSWSIGGDWVAERNEHYYQEGKPYLDGVIHRVIADANTLALALQTGEIDGSVYPSPTLKEMISENPEMEFIVPPFTSADGWTFNFDNEWLAKKEVRQAIVHAINVEQYAADSLMGMGGVAAGPIAPGNWAFDPELQPLAYDPEKSRELLAAAGFPDGTEIRGTVNIGNVLREDWLVFCQQALREVGITLKPEPQEYATLVAAVTSTGDFEMCGVNFGGVTADPGELANQFGTGAGGNFTGYSNPELDELLDAARQELDVEAAKGIYKQIQAILTEDAPIHFAWYRPFLNVINKKFTGYTPSNLEQFLFHSLEDIRLAE